MGSSVDCSGWDDGPIRCSRKAAREDLFVAGRQAGRHAASIDAGIASRSFLRPGVSWRREEQSLARVAALAGTSYIYSINSRSMIK